MSRPPIVGITGGIGAGKSTVCKVFETLGAITYYADDRARWLMNNDEQLVQNIKDLFGNTAYIDERLDRKHIASKVFKDKTLLEKLNQRVHPAVEKDVKKWTAQHQYAPLLLKEAALLFETGSYKFLDKTILITAIEEVRIQRVIQRDAHRTKEDIEDIINKQMRDAEKIPLADFVIVNDGKKSVISQVINLSTSLGL